MEILNAKIKDVSISMADYGCLTFWLYLKLPGGCCGYGGYSIGYGYLGSEEFEATDKGLTAMMHIMDTIGVEKWEDLVGKYCRVKSDGWGNSISIIGNIMEDKWFDIKEHFKPKESDL